MKKIDLHVQMSNIHANFPNIGLGFEMTIENDTAKKGTISLLVVPENMIPTKELFALVDLGRPEANSWFLDKACMYDLVITPNVPYILHGINVESSTLPDTVKPSYPTIMLPVFQTVLEEYRQYDSRPLTFHEVVTLAFQFPELFNENISGIQAYGSRFTKKQELRPDKDDTLEIYRKGDPGKGFLKLAREFQRYSELTKIIPFVDKK